MTDPPLVKMDLPRPLVETSWLAAHLDDPDLRLLDCSVFIQSYDGKPVLISGREEWDKGHIPGSVFVDVVAELSDGNNPSPMMMLPIPEFAEKMNSLGVGQGTKVIVYDRSEHAWAARVWWMLRVAGFDNAAVLNGGWKKWTTEDRVVSTEVTGYAEAKFVPNHRPELFAGKQEVFESIGKEAVCLINALSPDMFMGKISAHGRAGRIPGSENVFYQHLLDQETNTYLPVEELREKFSATRALGSERVITYCGGGVAATSDALVLTLLGMENVAVYDGSMSEWAADLSMPMETD